MPTQYTYDLTGGTTVTAKSNLAGNTPAEAIDNDNQTGCQCILNDTAGWWFKVDFGAGVTKTITKITLWTDNNYDGMQGALKDFKLQGSNNDSDWTDVTTQIYTPEDNTKQSFEFTNTTAYRYYRVLQVTSWHGDYCGISELEMMETVPFPPQIIII